MHFASRHDVRLHLTERLGITRIRVHDVGHLQQRPIRQVLAHTVAVFVNLRLGRSPLDLDGLVAASKELHFRAHIVTGLIT